MTLLKIFLIYISDSKKETVGSEKMNLSTTKSSKIKQSLVPAYISSDEEGTVGFITHQLS